MAVDDARGRVTIASSGRRGLYAEDKGLTVRNAASRAQRFGWSEVSAFVDGGGMSHGQVYWQLDVLLRSGRRVRADCTYGSPTPEILTAVQQIAERYGVGADLAGVPSEAGRPVRRGLYKDPAGQPGVRYWDGAQWSPLLPPDLNKRPSETGVSAGAWSTLPTAADGTWTYAALRAARAKVWLALATFASAALLGGGVVIALWWDRSARHHTGTSGWFTTGGSAALGALLALRDWSYFRKLDKAANPGYSGANYR